MPPKRTHEENRAALCIICLNKAKFLSKITLKVQELIEEYCMIGYDPSDDRLPTSICSTCRVALLQCKKSESALPPKMFDHSLIGVQPSTRSKAGSCSCKLCEIASSNINANAVGVKKKSRGRPSVAAATPNNSRKAIKVCTHCFSQIHPGMPHHCLKSSRSKHVQKLTAMSSPKCLEKVSLNIVKGKTNNRGELKLAAEHGPSMNLLLAPPPATSSSKISATNMAQLQTELNLSGRKTLKVASNLRYSSGSRFTVETGLRKKLAAKDHKLDDFFMLEHVPFVKIEKEKVVQRDLRWTVLCKNVNDLIKKVKNDRKVDEKEALVKTGIDGGGGFLKICLSVITTKGEEQEDEETSVPRKRRRRSALVEGITSTETFKESGVKRLLLLAAVPSVQENFDNLKLLWAKLRMHELECSFTIATDLKLCNILLGIMAHGCSHPCCWCDVHRSHLDKKGTARTTKTIQESFIQFRDSGKKRGMAKDFTNVVHLPIVTGQDNDTPVVQFVPPPELHLLIGPVNAMYRGLLDVWPGVSDWLKACNVEREAVHGGSFTGNSCQTLLQKSDILESMGPLEVLPYVAAFRAFRKVVTGCYGSFLDPNVEALIVDFKQKYLDLEISVTPKVHAVFHHILEFCKIHGEGLGPWSEQASESVHYDFQETWTRFKVRSFEHPDYGNRLLRAVCTYNSQHL